MTSGDMEPSCNGSSPSLREEHAGRKRRESAAIKSGSAACRWNGRLAVIPDLLRQARGLFPAGYDPATSRSCHAQAAYRSMVLVTSIGQGGLWHLVGRFTLGVKRGRREVEPRAIAAADLRRFSGGTFSPGFLPGRSHHGWNRSPLFEARGQKDTGLVQDDQRDHDCERGHDGV